MSRLAIYYSFNRTSCPGSRDNYYIRICDVLANHTHGTPLVIYTDTYHFDKADYREFAKFKDEFDNYTHILFVDGIVPDEINLKHTSPLCFTTYPKSTLTVVELDKLERDGLQAIPGWEVENYLSGKRIALYQPCFNCHADEIYPIYHQLKAFAPQAQLDVYCVESPDDERWRVSKAFDTHSLELPPVTVEVKSPSELETEHVNYDIIIYSDICGDMIPPKWREQKSSRDHCFIGFRKMTKELPARYGTGMAFARALHRRFEEVQESMHRLMMEKYNFSDVSEPTEESSSTATIVILLIIFIIVIIVVYVVMRRRRLRNRYVR